MIIDQPTERIAPFMTTTGAVEQQWEPTRHTITETIDKSVALTGAPDIIANGRPCSPYTIRFRYVRFSANGPWQAEITIYARTPGSLIGKSFGPDRVYMPPEWLTDIIDRATPAGRHNPPSELSTNRQRRLPAELPTEAQQ